MKKYSLLSDEVLAIAMPIVVYWAYSGLYQMLGSLDKYRLHSRSDENTKNLVSKRKVAFSVLCQQLIQSVALAAISFKGEEEEEVKAEQPPLMIIVAQFFIAMFVIDTWQYFWHRYMHLNKFMYKHIHSWHHRNSVPFSFAAQYNHPVEGFLLDTVGGVLAFVLSGMTLRTSIYFYSWAAMKGINDHCGLWLPGNVVNYFFWNNAAYHDVHHQLVGSKYNFSQPFFITWDKILGTYMPYTLQERPGGGLEAKPITDDKKKD